MPQHLTAAWNRRGELSSPAITKPDAIARFNYDVPPELERMTLKLLAKDVNRRYQSARDLLVDLRNLQREIETRGNRDQAAVLSGQSADEWEQRHAITGEFGIPAKTPPVSLPNPKDIGASDVVITYADLDDQPIRSGRPGWASQLHQNLQLRVAQLSGKQVAVVKQPDPSDSVRQVKEAK